MSRRRPEEVRPWSFANGGLGAPFVFDTGAALLASSDGQVVMPLCGNDFCGSAWKLGMARPVAGVAVTG